MSNNEETLYEPEPECTATDSGVHAWTDTGCQGHGGGVVCSERCTACGLMRVTDTWAQRRDTGEQGLRSVTYDDRDVDPEHWIDSDPVDID